MAFIMIDDIARELRCGPSKITHFEVKGHAIYAEIHGDYDWGGPCHLEHRDLSILFFGSQKLYRDSRGTGGQGGGTPTCAGLQEGTHERI